MSDDKYSGMSYEEIKAAIREQMNFDKKEETWDKQSVPDLQWSFQGLEKMGYWRSGSNMPRTVFDIKIESDGVLFYDVRMALWHYGKHTLHLDPMVFERKVDISITDLGPDYRPEPERDNGNVRQYVVELDRAFENGRVDGKEEIIAEMIKELRWEADNLSPYTMSRDEIRTCVSFLLGTVRNDIQKGQLEQIRKDVSRGCS